MQRAWKIQLCVGPAVYRHHRGELLCFEKFVEDVCRSEPELLFVVCLTLNVLWQDRATNTEVFKRTNCISIEAMLLKSCLRWTGHVIRMVDQ